MCVSERTARWRAADPQRDKMSRKMSHEKNRDSRNAAKKRHREENRGTYKAKDAAYYAKNSERIKAKEGARYWTDRTARLTKAAERRRSFPDKVRLINRASYQNHIEKRRAESRNRNKNNLPRRRANEANRRARIKMSEGRHSAADVERIYKAQRGRCAICRDKLNGTYHVDHIVPLSKGGSNWPKNIQCCCQSCNNRKYNKDPIEFAREMGLLL